MSGWFFVVEVVEVAISGQLTWRLVVIMRCR